MGNLVRLTRDEARQLAVIGQGLDRRPRGKATDERVLETIRRLGCVQLDTISVVARSHETVLFSRLGAFDPDVVWRLYERRQLTEYWVHAAAIVPVESLPHFRRHMEFWNDPARDVGQWLRENRSVVEQVMAVIAERGPAMSRDFERSDGPRPDAWTWYGGKPEKQALDYLWTTGDLAVVGRKGFQRVYDLPERFLPPEILERRTTQDEDVSALTRRGLSAMGITTVRWLRDYFRTGSRSHIPLKEAPRELDRLAGGGEAIRVEVEGWPEPAWIDAELLPRLEELRNGRGRPSLTTVLSPFDSLVWHRERLLTLFDFEYQIEVYTPEPKRVYGYYSLPVLHRGRMIGRVDLHYNRRKRLLSVRSAHLEPREKASEPNARALAAAIRDYLGFLGGGEIVVEKTSPEALRPFLIQAIEA